MLAPQADIVVTGMHLDDPMDDIELVSRLRHDEAQRMAGQLNQGANALAADASKAINEVLDSTAKR